MKRLIIIVEGQTEEEFVKEVVAPYLSNFGIFDVRATCIHTSQKGKGGFVSYAHLCNDVKRFLASPKDDFMVSMLVDFFRCPKLPSSERYENIEDHSEKADEMERCIADDIADRRFIPYIQLHEFEALLYASNKGFEEYFTEKQSSATMQIINNYPNPEDINSSPNKAPSKRLLEIKDDYEKVVEGNLIALSVGINAMIGKCPRFNRWIKHLIDVCR